MEENLIFALAHITQYLNDLEKLRASNPEQYGPEQMRMHYKVSLIETELHKLLLI